MAAGIDETTALLATDHDGPDAERQRRSYTDFARPLSSDTLPPSHEVAASAGDEPASAATIWTVVPVSLLGASMSGEIGGSSLVPC
jgi:hypothetical protein